VICLKMKLGDVRRHGRKKKTDPVILAAVVALGFIILTVLACVVPILMIDSAKSVACAPTDWLHRDEQTVCNPKNKKTYIAKVDSNASTLVKYYRLNKDDMSKTKIRTHNWHDRVDLSKGAYIFPITSSAGIKFDMNVTCIDGKCDTIKMWWLSQESFDNANKSGSFDESTPDPVQSDFSSPKSFTQTVDASSLQYLVFGNQKQASMLEYSITIDYTVYDMSSINPIECDKAECAFDSVATSEAIVMEYIDNDEKGPDYIAAEIKSEQGSIGGAVFVCVLFAVLAIGCFIFFILFLLQAFGKVSLYKKKFVGTQPRRSHHKKSKKESEYRKRLNDEKKVDEPENNEPENNEPENNEPENNEPENNEPENNEPEKNEPENNEPENNGADAPAEEP